MDIAQKIAAQANALLPLSALELPVQPVASLVAHLQSSNVHDAYFPFARFACVHAFRVSLGWAMATRGRRAGGLKDLAGYLVMAWGGSTLSAMLLSTPPPWLLSPAPWAIYVTTYVLFVSTRLSEFFVATCPSVLLNVLLAGLDGLLRGTGACAAASLATGKGLPLWTASVLAAVSTCAGGWVVQLLGMDTGVARAPGVLAGGLLPTLDVWGAMATSALYLALTGQNTAWAPVVQEFGGRRDAGTARGAAIIFFGCLFAARTLTQVAVAARSTGRTLAPAPGKNDDDMAAEKGRATAQEISERVSEKVREAWAPAALPSYPVTPVGISGAAKKRKNKKKAAAAH